MTVPRGAGAPDESPATEDDLLPRSERGQDEERSEAIDQLETGLSRPLSHDEQEAAERDRGRPERVFAPASMRVPKEPAPGHEALIDAGLAEQPEERRRAAEDLAREVGAQPPLDTPRSEPRQ